MALERLPQSLIVIGGSAVGLELAQMFARLSVRVTVLEALPRVVPAEDADIGNALADYLRSEGLDVYTDVRVDRVSRGTDGYEVQYHAGSAARLARAEQLLVATGRRANTAGVGIEPLVSKLPLEHVPRALAAHDTRGFIKLVADAGTKKIVGGHILAAEAGEMVTEPALAIKFGLTIEDLTSTFHPYLTLSEGIKLAAQAFTKDVAKLSCCAA